MADKKTNRLIPLIAIGLLVLTAAIFLGRSDKENATQMEAQGDQTVPDGDSTADTLRTLTALVQEVRDENSRLRTEQSLLRKELAAKPAPVNQSESKIEQLTKQLEALAQRQNDSPPPDLNNFDTDFQIPEIEPEGDIWIEPVDGNINDESGGLTDTSFGGTSTAGSASDILGDTSALDNSVGQTITGGNTQEVIIEPVYTVPRNSTLIGSTAMTALMGRVPINGTVEDPYPVKIIVGKRNLTANGMDLPEVNHMIFSGSATGDWTLSCVRADLTSVTYVFEDGTIQTLSVGDKELQNNNSSGTTNRLAWISDNRGIPCVSGRRISNAATFLAGSIFAKGVEAGAKAVADAETTRIVSSQGDTTESVTGDAVRNAGFETLSGGASAISEWLQERQQQTFDVVYVDTGSNVAVHIDAELPINYKPNGRKLRHARNNIESLHRQLD